MKTKWLWMGIAVAETFYVVHQRKTMAEHWAMAERLIAADDELRKADAELRGAAKRLRERCGEPAEKADFPGFYVGSPHEKGYRNTGGN
jgi:hypothetical protein